MLSPPRRPRMHPVPNSLPCSAPDTDIPVTRHAMTHAVMTPDIPVPPAVLRRRRTFRATADGSLHPAGRSMTAGADCRAVAGYGRWQNTGSLPFRGCPAGTWRTPCWRTSSGRRCPECPSATGGGRDWQGMRHGGVTDRPRQCRIPGAGPAAGRFCSISTPGVILVLGLSRCGPGCRQILQQSRETIRFLYLGKTDTA